MSIEQAKIMGFAVLLSVTLAGCSTALSVQSEANSSNASAGESGASVASSALISVQVNDGANGAPIDGLGAGAGDGTSEVALPANWTLKQGFNVPPGACLMSPTQFSNSGQGTYTVRVVPLLSNAACRWRSGDYHYVMQVQNGTRMGSGLGVLTIP